MFCWEGNLFSILTFVFPSIEPSIHSSIEQSIHPSNHSSISSLIEPSIHPSIHPSTIRPSTSITLYLPVYPYIYLPVHPPFNTSVCPPFCLPVHLLLYIYTYLYMHLPVTLYQFVRSSNLPRPCLSTYLPTSITPVPTLSSSPPPPPVYLFTRRSNIRWSVHPSLCLHSFPSVIPFSSCDSVPRHCLVQAHVHTSSCTPALACTRSVQFLLLSCTV